MRRGLLLLLMSLLVSGIQPVFALTEAPDAGSGIPQSLLSNQYYTESLRLTNLARLAYEYGDYDESTSYVAEAIRYARLSDEYVALRLKIREADNAMSAAKTRLDWAESAGAPARYPWEYGEALNYYNTGLALRSTEYWDGVIEAAGRVITLLAYVQDNGNGASLPAQYTVRAWDVSGDCFWNIAGRPWVYGDPRLWRLLYNANRAKLSDPDNPDLIEPGLVLDIPSVKGEARQGMWNANTSYTPLP